MRKHLFAKTAQDVRQPQGGHAAIDETQLHRDGEPCKPLQAREGGAAKPVSPMEFP